MVYFDYVVSKVFDILEDFFNTFTLVSGKTTLRVLYFSIVYLIISILSSITKLFSFSSIGSSLLAVVILIIINCISVITRKDIDKFKKLLKGDGENNE